jgi:hypothetical protein
MGLEFGEIESWCESWCRGVGGLGSGYGVRGGIISGWVIEYVGGESQC